MMRAAIFDAPGVLRLDEVARPEPGTGEVLVRVAAAGVCAGDLYIYTGKNPTRPIPASAATRSPAASPPSAPGSKVR